MAKKDVPPAAPPAGGDAEKKKADADKTDKKDKKIDRKSNLKMGVVAPEIESEYVMKTVSELEMEEALRRAQLRKTRFKRKWPEVTKVAIHTRPWQPPPPPKRPPRIVIELPALTVKKWVPPCKRRKRRRPRKLPRIPPEQLSRPLETNKLIKIWHNFKSVEKNKMMLQGSLACNNKKYSPSYCGAQTGCIALAARALLDEKTPADLTPCDVDDLIENGDRYYKCCRNALKCYKGNPKLQLNQLMPSFFLHDTKYTYKLDQVDQGLLAKHPDNLSTAPDLMQLMEKRAGQEYMHILTVGDHRHFLIWGHPPAPESGSTCKTVCYIFDPNMLDAAGVAQKAIGNHTAQLHAVAGESSSPLQSQLTVSKAQHLHHQGKHRSYLHTTAYKANANTIDAVDDEGVEPLKLSVGTEEDCWTRRRLRGAALCGSISSKFRHLGGCCGANSGGAGAFIRYAGINSFVVDFLANHGKMDCPKTKKPSITLTNVEIVQKETLIRKPTYALDLKTVKAHCPDEWNAKNINALLDKKIYEGKYPLASLSMESIAMSRANSRKRVQGFYQKSIPKEPPPNLPVMPDKGPTNPTLEQILSHRGENFFLYCPVMDGHTFGRDDLVPLPKSETVLHSPVSLADKTFRSQYRQLDVEKWILRATRHMASHRYQTFKWYTGIACCLAALGMLQRYRARAWNEDTLDETLDVGYNLFRESLKAKGGPVRRLVLGEHKESFKIRDRECKYKSRYVAIWGRLVSNNSKIFDLCKALDVFFKQSDSGILQIPGELEVAILYEGGKFYMYHPWPADNYGHRVSLYSGGKACILCFSRVGHMCDHFLESCSDMKKKPFSISDVWVEERQVELPEPVNKMQPVASNRWIVRGSFHEADERFPSEHRGRQATPASIAALAMAHVVDPADWTSDDVDETLVRGDILYQSTMENLEKMGINLDSPKNSNEESPEEEDGEGSQTGYLAATDVLNRFKVSDYDCIETDVMDSTYSGHLNPDPDGAPSLTEVLQCFFKENTHGVFTARGCSFAIWKHDGYFYFFDPHGCDENGLPSEEPTASACLMRVKGHAKELAAVLLSNLPPGSDDSFNISPVSITATKLNPEIGAPETKLESKAFEWIRKGTHAIMMGPRGENSAIGKAFEKANIKDDTAGRTLALPAAAAFIAASAAIPPPHMHMDHMYNFLDIGREYYTAHVRKTGRKEIAPNDLTDKFVVGENTMYMTLDEPTRLPLRLPDPEPGEGEGGGGDLGGMEEEEPETLKEMKELLFKMWYDFTKPTTVSLLVNDYYQLGIWMQAGGKVMAFDPAPCLPRGVLTSHRIVKGDELRLQRIKDEMVVEEGGDEEDDEEAGEGEAAPEPPPPEPVPPHSCPMLIVAASPGEFIDKLVFQGGLDKNQAIGPAWLYPANVTNEITGSSKDKRAEREDDEEAAGEDAEEVQIPDLSEAAKGEYFEKLSKTAAAVRGRVAQGEKYFMEKPNRNNQDAANSVMGIVVEFIEPYIYWKPELIDSIIKYGDRLYTMSIKNAKSPPYLKPAEIVPEFHVLSFNVKLDVTPDVVVGDTKAGDTGSVLNLRRGLKRFFETHKHGVICAKNYCAAVWKGLDEASYLLWEPHAVGPRGKTNPAGAATLVLYSNLDEIAEVFKNNVDNLGVDRPGNYNFGISDVSVTWEFSKIPGHVGPQPAVPDEGYEFKVLTAFVETARGRTILRGSRPFDLLKFTRDAILQSSCGAVVAAAMSKVRRPILWTRRTVDDVMVVAAGLFNKSVTSLGYEFRPGEDFLLPLQVVKRFLLGSNYVRFDLQEVYSGKLEQREPSALTLKAALERFFESYTHGILWSTPYAVAVWQAPGSPSYFMMEPHACGPTGLRLDAKDDGAACLLTFSSPKLMAFSYLQNTPLNERAKHCFQLSAMSIVVTPVKWPGVAGPTLTQKPTSAKASSVTVKSRHRGRKLVPATSKVYADGTKRGADEKDRQHPPGSATCLDAVRATEKADENKTLLKGQRNASGWLVLGDGTQFMSAAHSMSCKKFPYASRGYQALAMSVMAVAMSRVEDVCRWCSGTLDKILESGDMLYQSSYLHFKPKSKILRMEQVLRKFYAPGNCVCRVVIYAPRQRGTNSVLLDKLTQFFSEETAGVFVAAKGYFAVALFRTPRGFYMFDPADRDRYGRAVAPPCEGKARCCFSFYPNVASLAQKLGPNIPPPAPLPCENEEDSAPGAKPRVKFEEDSSPCPEDSGFSIYGMSVSSLRRLNKHER